MCMFLSHNKAFCVVPAQIPTTQRVAHTISVTQDTATIEFIKCMFVSVHAKNGVDL